MVETGVENGMVEITSEMDSSKKSLLRGALMPLTGKTLIP
jgi:hypothetical protein